MDGKLFASRSHFLETVRFSFAYLLDVPAKRVNGKEKRYKVAYNFGMFIPICLILVLNN
jgi:hypothetical protein